MTRGFSLWLLAVAPLLAWACGGSDAAPDTAIGGDTPQTVADSGTSRPDAASDAAAQPGIDAGRDYGTDATRFVGASRCAAASLVHCDGFEASALDAFWTPEGAVLPVLDSTRAARGSQSVRVHADDNGRSRLISTFTPRQSYWGRMFVWIAALPASPDYAHWTLMGASGHDLPGEIRVGGQLDPNRHGNRYGIGTDNGATGDWTNLDDDPAGADNTVATGKWSCLEWHHDAAQERTQFFLDAVEHPSLATTATQHGGTMHDASYDLPTFDSVWVGWWLYQGGSAPGAYDVWIDEVAFDPTRVGCIL